MNWILIIGIASGFGTVSDIKTVPMTEAQCRAAVVELAPLRSRVEATCVGPNGEVFNTEMARDADDR